MGCNFFAKVQIFALWKGDTRPKTRYSSTLGLTLKTRRRKCIDLTLKLEAPATWIEFSVLTQSYRS